MDFRYYFALLRRDFWTMPLAALVFVGILYWAGLRDLKTLSMFFLFIMIGGPIVFPFSPWRVTDNVAVYPQPIFGGYRKLFPLLPGWMAVLVGCLVFFVLLSLLALLAWRLF